ncbi:hypothetical protein M9H77_18014 [Catharanthus roseus]|uniref:Uncharacterized protein n=2 Tax=Catharanthus roseus TaxID=4058 RepID=A0ACC0B688_CATRO|nr:hypothetical protein M9H77_17996 [Catharanthus roseus]KAI5668161.1 hypothetical protein M9H77_18014 [Catharanthus roseus]
MISTRKLVRLARKWQKKAAIGRKRISYENTSTSACSFSSPMAEKGHVVVYTDDQKRYSFPISYLNNYIFKELLRMAEEEFGLPKDGPITIPCEAAFMDYLVSLIQKRATTEIEKALLMSISSCRCSSSSYTESSQHPPLYCF